jgi:peptidyl-prolyl cis-trans isomerase C
VRQLLEQLRGKAEVEITLDGAKTAPPVAPPSASPAVGTAS